MTKLRLSMALHGYDRVQPIADGRVPVEGCDPNVIPLGAEEAFARAFAGEQFDVTEMSLSSYLIGLSRGHAPYIAIPVFLSRAFRHSSIYVREDRNIATPEDLVGKLVGVPEYQMTAAVWVRGMLSDHYGVPPEQIRWRTGGLEKAGRGEKLALPDLPGEIRPIEAGETLSTLLANGALDAVVSARAPSCLGKGAGIRRLFQDTRAAEQSYFHQTGIFPIMHVVALRKTLMDAHPWLPRSLFKAFSAAKALAMLDLQDVGVLQVMLPWLHAELDAVREIMGADFWPYGLDANRSALETIARYLDEQGLTSKPISVDEMFAQGSDTAIKV